MKVYRIPLSKMSDEFLIALLASKSTCDNILEIKKELENRLTMLTTEKLLDKWMRTSNSSVKEILEIAIATKVVENQKGNYMTVTKFNNYLEEVSSVDALCKLASSTRTDIEYKGKGKLYQMFDEFLDSSEDSDWVFYENEGDDSLLRETNNINIIDMPKIKTSSNYTNEEDVKIYKFVKRQEKGEKQNDKY